MGTAVYNAASKQYLVPVAARFPSASRQHQLWAWPADLSSPILDGHCLQVAFEQPVHSVHALVPLVAARPRIVLNQETPADSALASASAPEELADIATVFSDGSVQLGSGDNRQCTRGLVGTLTAAAAHGLQLVLACVQPDSSVQLHLFTRQVSCLHCHL